MNFNKCDFETSFGTFNQIPPSDLPEICFSGRSNSGKSSLINKLLNRKNIARVSSRPGKTVTINFFKGDNYRFVDLPGYGYAKLSANDTDRFSELMEGYFTSKRNIALCVQLVDMRIGPTEMDLNMIDFLKSNNIPLILVLTKCDKLNKTDFNNMLNTFNNDEDLEGIIKIPFSSLKNIGIEELKTEIEKHV